MVFSATVKGMLIRTFRHTRHRRLRGLFVALAFASLIGGCGKSGSDSHTVAATKPQPQSTSSVQNRPCGTLTSTVADEVLEHKAESEVGNGAKAATNCIYYYALSTPLTRAGGGLMTNAKLELEWSPGEGTLALQEEHEGAAGSSRHALAGLGPGAFIQIGRDSTITSVAAYADVRGDLLKLTAEAPALDLGRLESAFRSIGAGG
jgi:hypothetical protein